MLKLEGTQALTDMELMEALASSKLNSQEVAVHTKPCLA